MGGHGVGVWWWLWWWTAIQEMGLRGFEHKPTPPFPLASVYIFRDPANKNVRVPSIYCVLQYAPIVRMAVGSVLSFDSNGSSTHCYRREKGGDKPWQQGSRLLAELTQLCVVFSYFSEVLIWVPSFPAKAAPCVINIINLELVLRFRRIRAAENTAAVGTSHQ